MVALAGAVTTLPAGAATARTPAAAWKWSKFVAIPGKGVSLGGMRCPSVHLCVADGNLGKKEGIFYTTNPAGGGKTWKFVAWSEAFSGGGSGEDVSCDQAGVHVDCALAGYAPIKGHPGRILRRLPVPVGQPDGAQLGGCPRRYPDERRPWGGVLLERARLRKRSMTPATS